MALNRLCAMCQVMVPSMKDNRLCRLFVDQRCILVLMALCWLYSVVITLAIWLRGQCIKLFAPTSMSFLYKCVDISNSFFVNYQYFNYCYPATCLAPYIALFLLLRHYRITRVVLGKQAAQKREREERVLFATIKGVSD